MEPNEVETDYWKNLTVTHTCGDWYPGGDYADYPEKAENVFSTVLLTLASLNFVIPIGGLVWSFGRPLFQKNTPSVNLLDVFTLISSICYFSFWGQVQSSAGEYATMDEPRDKILLN